MIAKKDVLDVRRYAKNFFFFFIIFLFAIYETGEGFNHFAIERHVGHQQGLETMSIVYYMIMSILDIQLDTDQESLVKYYRTLSMEVVARVYQLDSDISVATDYLLVDLQGVLEGNMVTLGIYITMA